MKTNHFLGLWHLKVHTEAQLRTQPRLASSFPGALLASESAHSPRQPQQLVLQLPTVQREH